MWPYVHFSTVHAPLQQWKSAISTTKIKLSSKRHFSLWNFHKKMILWVFIFQLFSISGHFPVSKWAKIAGVPKFIYSKHLHPAHFPNSISKRKMYLFDDRKLKSWNPNFWNIFGDVCRRHWLLTVFWDFLQCRLEDLQCRVDSVKNCRRKIADVCEIQAAFYKKKPENSPNVCEITKNGKKFKKLQMLSISVPI